MYKKLCKSNIFYFDIRNKISFLSIIINMLVLLKLVKFINQLFIYMYRCWLKTPHGYWDDNWYTLVPIFILMSIDRLTGCDERYYFILMLTQLRTPLWMLNGWFDDYLLLLLFTYNVWNPYDQSYMVNGWVAFRFRISFI